MDKLKFLKRFKDISRYRLLRPEELKLYIFLLICADGLEVKGRINLELLRRVLGERATLNNIKTMASNLNKYGLADIVIPEQERELCFIIHEIENG